MALFFSVTLDWFGKCVSSSGLHTFASWSSHVLSTWILTPVGSLMVEASSSSDQSDCSVPSCDGPFVVSVHVLGKLV